MLVAGGHVQSCSGGSRLCQLLEEGRQARTGGEQGKQAHGCAVLSVLKAAAEQRLTSTGEPRTARAAAFLQNPAEEQTDSLVLRADAVSGECWSCFRRRLGFGP